MARAYRHQRDMMSEDPGFCMPMLASQLAGRRWSGEQLLMAAVLFDVIVLISKRSDSSEYGRLVREARDWLETNNDEWLYSFVNICHELGLNVQQTRRHILRDRPALSKHLLHSRGNDNFRKINS